MTAPRPDDAIRADVERHAALFDQPVCAELNDVDDRLAHDVAPLLARAVAAEARAEKAEQQRTDWREAHAILASACKAIAAERDEAGAELAEARARVTALRELPIVMLEQFTEYTDETHAYMTATVGATVINAWRAALAAASPPEEEPEPEDRQPCEGFRWIGQSWATCDRCGQPYWKHTHEEKPTDRDPFGAEPFKLVPITPEQAAAMARKWCPTCSGPSMETVGMVCQTCGTDYAAASPTPPPEGQR